MKFSFDAMNNINEQPDVNSGENEVLENENPVDEMPEIKNWRESNLSDEQKIEIIKERRGKIDRRADKFGLDLKEDIEDVKDDLDEEYVKYAKLQEDLNTIDKADLESDAKEGLEEMKNVLSSLNGIYKKQLQIEYIKYIEEYKKGLEDPKLLLKSFAKRNLLMDKWETLIGGIQTDLNKTGEDEEETMRAWARWVKEHPEISLALLAVLVAAGVTTAILLAPEMSGGGLPTIAMPAIKGGLGMIAKAFSGAVGTGTGALIGAGVLGKAIAWLSDEENRDKTLEGIFGAKIPSFAYWANGRPGAKKTA